MRRNRFLWPVVALGLALTLGACGGDDGGGDAGPASAEAVQACLEDEGLTVERRGQTEGPLAGIDQLAVEDFSDGTLYVAEDEGAATQFFEEDGSALGSGASESDWFRVGNVVVRFGENSTTANHDIAEECARG